MKKKYSPPPAYPGGSTQLMRAQLGSRLIHELRGGIFSQASRLPSEVALAEMLGVSRTVVRDALSDLERAGFIERTRGAGTVINRAIADIDNRFDLKAEYNELIKNAGCRPSCDSISLSPLPADDEIADGLFLEPGAPVVRCAKRLLADERPVIWSEDYLPLSLFKDVSYDELDWSLPVFELLERYFGLYLGNHLCRISAVAPDDILSLLQAPKNSALLLVSETAFCRRNTPILYSHQYYTDFFDFFMLRKKI